jgi:hypothetical protein
MPELPRSSFRVIVEPMCGLCNRMRVIDGALSLARKEGGVLDVIWFCDPDLNCRFTDLFEPLTGPVHFWNLSMSAKFEKWFKRMIHAYLKRACGRYLLPLQVQKMTRAGHDFSELTDHKRVFLKTWDRFWPTASPFSDFRPVPAIQALIEREARTLDHAIGLHIRRTDCSAAIENSPTTRFIARMEQELQMDPQAHFFLATDDAVEERLLKQRFPGKIQIYQKRTRSRNERAGIEDALVDLFCLARCRKVLGSSESSFSETAIALSKREGVFIR